MISLEELKKSLQVSVWFAFLTFPILVIKADPIERTVQWRWENMFYIALGSFVVSLLVRAFNAQHARRRERRAASKQLEREPLLQMILKEPRYLFPLAAAVGVFALAFPHLFSIYQTNIMITALMYVVLGLGLNIVVGLAGLLDLGYVAFYAVGAYTYALLNMHFDMGFWMVLPIGAMMGALFGILLGFPVLRLRGDYLAIVTLGFGEIIRLILNNWDSLTGGPDGIGNIPKPTLFGLEFGRRVKEEGNVAFHEFFDIAYSGTYKVIFLYLLAVVLVLFTLYVINRLIRMPVGRAWEALRENEIAARSLGLNPTNIKLSAFTLGATFGGLAGAFFAARQGFINPESFTFIESAIVLAIVVLGGMGSQIGVILAAVALTVLPELAREFQEYRMLIFGAVMVLMMIWRPQGLLPVTRPRMALPT